jgi:drug/metabolite transporter (DMT)-like permease
MRLFMLTALTMVAFAANSVLNRWAVAPGHIGAMEFAVLRVLSGAVVLAGLMLWRRGRVPWAGWQGRIGGVLGLTAYLIGFSLAYLGLDAATGALVLFGMVQVTMFAGAVLAAEPIPPRRWAGAGLALSGLALIALPGGDGVASGGALALMAAAGVGWGLYSLAGRGAADPLGATAWNFILAVPVLAVLGLALGTGGATGTGIGLAIISGGLTSALGYALWYAILPALGATRAAVAQLSVPVLAALGGALLLAEVPGLRFWVATALVLGGIALATLARRS